MDDKEPFLSRWSRLKRETNAQPRERAEPAAELPSAAAQSPAASEQAESREPATPEFREFFDPKVDEVLRRAALKKLFSDPHFNVMDGLDTYIDDYSKPDPIPAAMLRQLNQSKDLFLFDEEQEAGARARAAGEPVPAASADAAPADAAAPAAPAGATLASAAPPQDPAAE
jgi:hypothetical protein